MSMYSDKKKVELELKLNSIASQYKEKRLQLQKQAEEIKSGKWGNNARRTD